MIEPRANPELLGQERAWTVLAQALRVGRMPHAWLLSGPRGVGKATLAYRFTRRLLAREASPWDDLPPADPLFRQVAQGAHPDLRALELPRDQKTGRLKGEIGVDVVREAAGALHGTAALGGRRVLVIDGAESLNRNAANALLKPLEEPPPGVVMLLVTHDPARLLPTIRSRCALLRLARLAPPVIERILARQAPDLDPELRPVLARLAGGSAGRGLEMAAGGLDLYRSIVRVLGAGTTRQQDLAELAQRLHRHAETAGSESVLGLLQLLIARIVGLASGRLEAALFDEEPEALRRLAARRPLDQWAMLWEKVARLLRRADVLNLDRNHVLLLALGDMTGRPRGATWSDPALRGGFDAVG